MKLNWPNLKGIPLRVYRDKLRQFLESSRLYHAPELLGKLQDTDLHMECAILYGRVRRLGP